MVAHNGFELEPTYYNTNEDIGDSGVVPGVPVKDFPNYIKEMEADKTRLKEEYSVTWSKRNAFLLLK